MKADYDPQALDLYEQGAALYESAPPGARAELARLYDPLEAATLSGDVEGARAALDAMSLALAHHVEAPPVEALEGARSAFGTREARPLKRYPRPRGKVPT